MGKNIIIALYGMFYIGFLRFFFAKCDLISLRNMPTKFRESGMSGSKVIKKVGVNLIISF
jgi:hypothetical protein